MKRKWLFLSVAGMQIAFCIVYSLFLAFAIFNTGANVTMRSIFFALFLLAAVYPAFCIYLCQKKYPDGYISKKLNNLYSAACVFYFLLMLMMIAFSFIWLGDILTFISYPELSKKSGTDIAFECVAIFFTVSMFYLMSAAIRMIRMIKKNHVLKQNAEIAQLGDLHTTV